MEVQLHTSLPFALGNVQWFSPQTNHLTLRKNFPPCPLNKKLVGPHSRSGRNGKVQDISLRSQHHHITTQYRHIYRVSQEECARLREGVPYAKLYRYNPKHLSPKWNGYGDNGQRKVWSSCGSTHCTCRLTLSPPSPLNVVSHDKLSAGRWAVNFTP